jgi:hypothetical protein
LKDEKQVLYNFKALKELKLLLKEAMEWLHILYPHLQISTSLLDISFIFNNEVWWFQIFNN